LLGCICLEFLEKSLHEGVRFEPVDEASENGILKLR